MVRPVLRLIASVVMALVPAFAAGQTPSRTFAQYTSIVEAYRGGRDTAPQEIASWPQADVEQMLGPAAGAGVPFTEAAAMLHTEAAVAMAARDWPRASAQLAVAQALVQALPATAETFVERYYAFTATLFLARGDAEAARSWIDRGLTLFEYSPPLRTASGMVEELAAHLADPECAGRECAGARGGSGAVHLAVAEREYRVALARDSGFADARVRLGRVLATLGRDADAATELVVAAMAPAPRIRYFAHLFTADMAARMGDSATARQEYQAALAEEPGAQTPYLALSHIEEALGNAVRARELVAQFVQRGGQAAADPWWGYQNGELDADTLRWLIDFVRR